MINLYWLVAEEEHHDSEIIEKTYSEYTVELSKRGIAFKFLPLRKTRILYKKSGDYGVFNSGEKLNTEKSAFIISPADLNSQARAFSFSLRNYLRITDAAIMNESINGVETIEWDKVSQMMLASSLGAPVMPFSVLGYHCQIIPSITEFLREGHDMLIFKPVGSGMGFGIIKTEGEQQAFSTGNIISSSSIPYFVMPFIRNANDVRFYFIGGDLMFVKIRVPQGKGYLSNVCLGGKQKIMSKEEYINSLCSHKENYYEILNISEKMIKKTNAEILSIDWLMNEEEFFFNEMRTVETDLTKLPDNIRPLVFDKIAYLIMKKTAVNPIDRCVRTFIKTGK